jgi:hypothetical protein
MTITRARATLATALLLTLAATAPAQTPPAPSALPEVSKETRDKMAALHEQMASCLRSDKSLAACRSQMVKDCQEQLGTLECALSGMGRQVDPRRRMQAMGATAVPPY